MNFLKITPHRSAKLASTIISDCCLGITSHAHSFALADANLKTNIFKYGVLGSNTRTRLPYSGSTNLDKNSPADIELGNGYALKEGIESTSPYSLGPVYDEVIRKVLSPSSLDPVKVKKDRGLLDDQELEKLESLEKFVYEHRFDHGCLVIKAMDSEHMEDTIELLTESFAELMWGPLTYKPLLKFTIRDHMMERRALVPHAITLVGLYAEREGEWTFCGTVEISLNSKGASKFHTTPVPPKSSPYLFNMAVNKDLRRRGIGWQLLKASEKLVTHMGSGEMYLHCRMIDTAPFNMYTKAGYEVVETDSILTLLTLQRRKHLMYKKLPLTS